MTDKKASTDYPIHELLAERWSPYGFEDRPVAQAAALYLRRLAGQRPPIMNSLGAFLLRPRKILRSSHDSSPVS